jgi:beta-mannanase
MGVDTNLLLLLLISMWLAYRTNWASYQVVPAYPTGRNSYRPERKKTVEKEVKTGRKAWRAELGASRRGSGYVYAWQDPDQPQYVKIGKAKNWYDRIGDFQTAVPKKIKIVCVIKVKDAYEAEGIIHDRFERYHLKLGGGHEWFKSNRTILAYLREISDEIPRT